MRRQKREADGEEKKDASCAVAHGAIVFASLSPSVILTFLFFFLLHVRVNLGEFNTRLNVRERYADLRQQFITHFKADDVENARWPAKEGGPRLRAPRSERNRDRERLSRIRFRSGPTCL